MEGACSTRGEDGLDSENPTAGGHGKDGTAGADGQKGDKGDKGDHGDHGDKGDKGDHGDHGDKGDKGDHGDKGDKGDKGQHGRGARNVILKQGDEGYPADGEPKPATVDPTDNVHDATSSTRDDR